MVIFNEKSVSSNCSSYSSCLAPKNIIHPVSNQMQWRERFRRDLRQRYGRDSLLTSVISVNFLHDPLDVPITVNLFFTGSGAGLVRHCLSAKPLDNRHCLNLRLDKHPLLAKWSVSTSAEISPGGRTT